MLGTKITTLEVRRDQLSTSREILFKLLDGELGGLKITSVISESLLKGVVRRLQAEPLCDELNSPNEGMRGGELLTLGSAATPTFTALNGPIEADYRQSMADSLRWRKTLFQDYDFLEDLEELFSSINGGRRARPAPFRSKLKRGLGRDLIEEETWLPFNYRLLPSGQQIYTHYDNHYRLPIYDHLSERYNRELVLSWFLTAQSAEAGGDLVMYGLSGEAPNVPMLPTRFVDTAELEANYYRKVVNLAAGDLFIFNSKAHIHRVTSVLGERSRVTIGGFMTVDQDREECVFWS